MNKTIFKLLALLMCILMLAGCGNVTEETESSSTETTEDTTEATIEGLEGENGKKLTVDFKTHGTVAEGAGDITGTTLEIGGLTLEIPVSIAALVENGWTFYSEETGAKPVSPETEAEVMGFSLYRDEQAWIELSRVQNPLTEAAPISQCYATKITINTIDLTQEGVAFTLPGGITRNSTAADVLEIYGPVTENDFFESVTVNAHMIYYSQQETSGLCYFFNFNDDGTLQCVSITYLPE